MRFRQSVLLILLLCVLVHLMLGLYAARQETPTVDEYAHMPAGLSYGSHGTWALYSKNPPLIKLWTSLPAQAGWAGDIQVPQPDVPSFGWGPWLYGMKFEKLNPTVYLDAFFAARIMVLLLSVASGFLIFLWLRRETDDLPAAMAAGGFWLSQTVLAHAHLATVDVGFCFALLLFAFYASQPRVSLGSAAVLGMSFAAALASKFTAVFALPLLLVALGRPPRAATRMVIGLFAAVCTLQLCYLFSHPFTWLGDFKFVSRAFLAMQNLLPHALPVPLPQDFVLGFDAQVGDTETGEFSNFLLGQWSREGWWYYSFVALLLKENILTLLLLIAAPFVLVRRGFSTGMCWALATVFLIALPMIFANPLQVGIRYLLPVFPFVFIIVGYVLDQILRLKPKVAYGLMAVLFVVWTGSAVWASPSHLSYFNALADRLGPHEDLLLDSNLDWGQDLYRLREWQGQGGPLYLLYFGHVSPSLYGLQWEMVPDHPVEGDVVVSANFFKGMNYVAPTPDGAWAEVSGDRLHWLRAYKPTARLGSLLIFDTRSKASP
ncbi:MAG: hypothetical protein KF799_01065 [Bdellovibrionales bacterium]|nr:hypothetical protein [Bdellovibrionales bacterium]